MSWPEAPPRHGWGVRGPLEVLGRTAAVHVVLMVNYIHLQRTQKVGYSSRKAQVLRLILFFFMPTLVIAELLMNAFRTFLLFLHSDSTKLTLRVAMANWKRYLCGFLGMHVAPKPAFEQDADEEVAAEPQASSSTDIDDSAAATPATAELLPRLSTIQDFDDLEHLKQRWSFVVVGRILLLLLPIAQAVGTMVLWARRIDSGYWHMPLSLDKRNLVAAMSSIVCSLLAIILISCRSEWSLKTLNSANSRKGDYSFLLGFVEIVIASIINEGPYANVWYVQPVSWIDAVVSGLGISGVIYMICFGFLTWLLVWGFDEKIKERVTINWNFVLGLPIAFFTIWIFIDLFAYVANDIGNLTEYSGSGVWDRDPWSTFLPIC